MPIFSPCMSEQIRDPADGIDRAVTFGIFGQPSSESMMHGAIVPSLEACGVIASSIDEVRRDIVDAMRKWHDAHDSTVMFGGFSEGP